MATNSFLHKQHIHLKCLIVYSLDRDCDPNIAWFWKWRSLRTAIYIFAVRPNGCRTEGARSISNGANVHVSYDSCGVEVYWESFYGGASSCVVRHLTGLKLRNSVAMPFVQDISRTIVNVSLCNCRASLFQPTFKMPHNIKLL